MMSMNSNAHEQGHYSDQEVAHLAECADLCVADCSNLDLIAWVLRKLETLEPKLLSDPQFNTLNKPLSAFAGACVSWLAKDRRVDSFEVVIVAPTLRQFLVSDWSQVNHVDLDEFDAHYLKSRRHFREAGHSKTPQEVWNAQAKGILLAKLAVDCWRAGELVALENFLTDIVVSGRFFPYVVPTPEMAEKLARAGWHRDLRFPAFLPFCESLLKLAPITLEGALIDILNILNYREGAPLDYKVDLTNYLVMPLARRFCELGMLENAYLAIHIGMTFYGYQLVTEDDFSSWIETFALPWYNAARRVSFTGSSQPDRSVRPRRIAFITRGTNISISAAEHFLPIMEYVNNHHSEDFKAEFFVFDTYAPDIESECQRRNIPVFFVTDEGIGAGRLPDKIMVLQRMLASRDVDIAVWTHAFDLAYFAMGLRLAPLQILFSQYLHPRPRGIEVDAYMTWGSPFLKEQMFNGIYWRVVPSILRFDFSTPDEGEVERLRRSYGAPDKLVCGTIARTDKIRQPAFLETVCNLLRAHDNMVFLWSGQSEHSDIVDAFRAADVLDRTHFIGWVDVALYARVLDVFLDSFPLSNGITALQAMRAATPFLSLRSDLSYSGRDVVYALDAARREDSPQRSLAVELESQLAALGLSQFPAAADVDEYRSMFSLLAADPDLRKRWGLAWKMIYELLYTDDQLMGSAFTDHLYDLVGSKNNAEAGTL